MKTQELKSLHSKSRNKSVMDSVMAIYGDRCVNCGSTEEIEFHHIVPLYVGGTNRPENIVPLCASCHHAMHYGIRIDEHMRRRKACGGRPSKEISDDGRDALAQYMWGQIPKTVACKAIGVARIDQCRPMRCVKEIMDSRGVEKFKNNLEVKLVLHGSVKEGDEVGWIIKKSDEKKIYLYAWRDMTAEEFGLKRRGA